MKFETCNIDVRNPLSPIFEMSTIKEGPAEQQDIMFADTYLITLKVGCVFYANSATLRDAERHAVKSLASQINREAMIEISKLKAIAFKYSDGKLHQAIDKVEAALLGCVDTIR